MKIKQVILLAITTLLSGIALATDVALVPLDLGGKWVWGEKKDCESGVAQYMTFSDNGTIELGKGYAPTAVGFWTLKDNTISIHILVTPGETDDSNVFYKGRYTYSYATAEILEASEGLIEIITGTTGDTKRSTLTKCE